MMHPKLKEAIERANSAKVIADRAIAWTHQIDGLSEQLLQLGSYSRVVSVIFTNGDSHSVLEKTGKAIAKMVIDAYECERSELNKKLESLDSEDTD